MSHAVARILRIPAVVFAVWLLLAYLVPLAMTRYAPFTLRPGLSCAPQVGGTVVVITGVPTFVPPAACQTLAELYRRPFVELFVDAMFRSLALLVGAALLAVVVGTLLGAAAALLRRRAFASGGILAGTSLVTAVPAFFVAYFLQITVIVLGAGNDGGRLLPVFGFGYDEHIVLPLLSISLPAIAYTAQLTATRMGEVLDADFITAANARGLRTSWILRVHVLPHVRPVVIEALGSGLRVSVASLPIVEFIFGWGGIGELSLAAFGIHDASGFVFSAVALTTLFATLSAIADISRPRVLYRTA